ALIFGSIAATLVSLFFIPVLMDNADAMMPDSGTRKLCEEEKNSWCILGDNIRALFPHKIEEDDTE
ncbi:MAG TPA: hypothetical protein ENK77_02430, partial [Epsilonproteobacteria bacterium]|nr:hypothetical protein [Campylobacterota bacterium]